LDSALPILFITYSFPPDADIGGKRIARLCRYLPEYGVRPIVLTVEDRFYERLDYSYAAPSGTRVERTAVLPSPLDWHLPSRLRASSGLYATGKGSRPVAKSNSGFLRRQASALLGTPDRYWGWCLPAVRAAGKLIQDESVAAIISTSPPPICHLIARRLKTRYHLPWLADFRDPWTLQLEGSGIDWPGWSLRLNRHLETSFVRSADVVICNTEPLRQVFTQDYPELPRAHFVTLTNGFEDSPVPRVSTKSSEFPRLLLHFGSLYALRRIDTFCQAVADLVTNGKLDPRSFKLVFLGETDLSLISGAERAPELIRAGCLEFRRRVGWEEAQQVLWDADLLLLFQGGVRRPGWPRSVGIHVPAKFYECLATGKPIFAIADEGALTDLLDSTGSGTWADPGDPSHIASKLLEALELPAYSPHEVQRRLNHRFHFRSLAAQLTSWIRPLTACEAGTPPLRGAELVNAERDW
jgi:Glycosyl transferase 4-like domain